MIMDSRSRMLRFLMDNREEAFSINAISKKLALNYRIAFDGIKQLEKKNAVSIKKLGNSNQCTFSHKFNEQVLAVENIKREVLLANKNLKVLFDRISKIQNPFFICLIFGSYAKGTQTKQSDIDLCIITDDEDAKQQISQITRSLPLQIHLLDFSTKDFLKMLKTTEQNVGKEITRNNIILKGTENYYELINYAR